MKKIRIPHVNQLINRISIYNFLVSVIIAFGVVSFWRGVWLLWDQLVFPNNKILSAVLSLISGIFILIIFKSVYAVFAPPMKNLKNE